MCAVPDGGPLPATADGSLTPRLDDKLRNGSLPGAAKITLLLARMAAAQRRPAPASTASRLYQQRRQAAAPGNA